MGNRYDNPVMRDLGFVERDPKLDKGIREKFNRDTIQAYLSSASLEVLKRAADYLNSAYFRQNPDLSVGEIRTVLSRLEKKVGLSLPQTSSLKGIKLRKYFTDLSFEIKSAVQESTAQESGSQLNLF